MGSLKEKKTAIGITGIVSGAILLISVLANLGQIKETWFPKKPESSSSQQQSSSVESTKEKNNGKSSQINISDDSYSAVVTEPPTEAPTEPLTEPPPTEPPVVYLSDLKAVESSMFDENIESAGDTVGNRYYNHFGVLNTNGYELDMYRGTPFVTYYLGGKYKTLTGTIAVYDKSVDKTSELIISCDDNVVFGTGEVSRTFAPEEFSINVENCQWLKFSVVDRLGNRYLYAQYIDFIIANCILE